MIDDIDRQILNILQQNARTSNAEIARQVGMAPSAILERIRRMEIKGVIQGYEARIHPEALGLNLLAFVSVSSTDHGGDMRAAQALSEMPEVQEVHHIAGEDCYLVKVRVPDAKTLGRLLRKWVASIGSIKSTRTTVVLESVHETARLPLGALGALDAPAAEELEEVFHV